MLVVSSMNFGGLVLMVRGVVRTCDMVTIRLGVTVVC